MNLFRLILTFALVIAAFLRLYRIDELMVFIGDQGWFYLSARDFLVTGNIPLVGITASHTWLHQGAIWTYLLTPALLLFNFNPVAGGFLAAILGVVSVFVIYLVGKTLFKDEQVGIMSSLLFATSPLVIIHSRIPYHTTPISLATLLFIFFIYKYSTGKLHYLPLATFLLGILYNLELATMVFWPLLVFFILIVRKIPPKILALSIVSFLIPMIPMIIYDFVSRKGFFQTTAFLRLIKINIFSANGFSPAIISDIFRDLFIYNQRLVFLGSGPIAAAITLGSFIYFINELRNKYRKKKVDWAYVILSLWIAFSLGGIFISKTASEAYLPMLYPGIILLVAFFLGEVIKKRPALKTGVYIIIGVVSFINVYLLLSQDYLMRGKGYGSILSDKVEVAKQIVSRAGENRYNIVGKGGGSQFESFTNNYEYITWWLGNPPSKNKEKLQFIIKEQNGQILLDTKQK